MPIALRQSIATYLNGSRPALFRIGRVLELLPTTLDRAFLNLSLDALLQVLEVANCRWQICKPIRPLNISRD